MIKSIIIEFFNIRYRFVEKRTYLSHLCNSCKTSCKSNFPKIEIGYKNNIVKCSDYKQRGKT
jgi:hypothetical protein